jgi:hypothetical protein
MAYETSWNPKTHLQKLVDAIEEALDSYVCEEYANGKWYHRPASIPFTIPPFGDRETDYFPLDFRYMPGARRDELYQYVGPETARNGNPVAIVPFLVFRTGPRSYTALKP